MSTMPAQKPGKSEQVVATPSAFLMAVKNRFSYLFEEEKDFAIDLAASPDNAVVDNYYTEADNALIQPWHQVKGVCWCNPPYADIKPWVAKAVEESNKGANIFMLLPASVGSNWWRQYVDRKSWAMFLNGRLTFVGHTSPYPKDLALVIYNRIFHDESRSNYSVFPWKDYL